MSELKLGQSREYLDKKAREENLVVFLPQPNEVFLDVDLPFMLDWEPGYVLDYINNSMCMEVLSTLVTRSKSGNKHIYMRFSRDLSDLERVIFQVCLGSDSVKELFSFIQLKLIAHLTEFTCECPVALFETASQAAEVNAWREREQKKITAGTGG